MEMQESGHTKMDFWSAFLGKHPLKHPSADLEFPSFSTLQQQHKEGDADLVPPVAVIVKDVLHQSEADSVQDLRRCLSEHHPRLAKTRSFDKDGGHHCVYLSAFLQWLAPGVAAQVRNAGHIGWLYGHWSNYTPPSNLTQPNAGASHMQGYPSLRASTTGIRTSEHLSYDGWKALGPHKDSGSLYTVLIMLSNPADYDGGEFYMTIERSGHFQNNKQQLALDKAHPPMVSQ